MPITINGVELSDTDIENELSPTGTQQEALNAAVLRRVLLDEAKTRGIPPGSSDEATIDALMSSALQSVPAPTPDECARHYHANPERWRVGERATVSHILFQVTERVDLEKLRARAQQALDALAASPATLDRDFADTARTLSNCPSGRDGGVLGEINRGDAVPAFEKAVFAAPPDSLVPSLVETEFGFHIVRVHEKTPGKVLPFEQAEARIRNAMSLALGELAERQFLIDAVGRATITGWKDGTALG